MIRVYIYNAGRLEKCRTRNLYEFDTVEEAENAIEAEDFRREGYRTLAGKKRPKTQWVITEWEGIDSKIVKML